MDERMQYYDFEKYMVHINGCKGSGDQSCPCGMASVRWNLDQLLDDHVGVKPTASIKAGKPNACLS